MQHIPVPDKIPLGGVVRATAFEVDDDLDDMAKQIAAAERLAGMSDRIESRAREIIRALIASFEAGKITVTEFVHRCSRAAHNAKQIECRRALREGMVKGVRPIVSDVGHNLILRNFYEDLFARFVDGNGAGVNQTLQIKYLALGTSYAQSTFAQADLTNEFFRKALDPDDTYDDGLSTFYASLYLKKSEANPNSTTATSGTSTTITLTSPTGFVSGGRAQLVTANNTYNFTYTLSGSVLTCSDITGGSLSGASAFDAADLPVNTNTVTVLISEGGCIIGDDATSTLNTGKPLNRKRLETLKTTAISLSFDFILTATSIDS